MEPDIADLEEQIVKAEAEMRDLVRDLTEDNGTAQPANGSGTASWSVAGCLDHVARTNRVYLAKMGPAAELARAKRRMRRGAARPGVVGRWFASLLEPPVKPGRKLKAPKTILPSGTVSLADASASFAESQNELRIFLHRNADLDLTGVMFPNPFVRGIRFSLATGLCNLMAHERRHLWQARQVLLSLGQGEG